MSSVSIVIPCYNGGSMVKDAVDSAVAQTHEDTEILIVNDGSTDPLTLATLQLIESDARVRVIHQENAGLPKALNRAVHESTGDYILPLAHDDEFYPTYAARASEALDADPAVGIVYCRAERFGASHGEWHLRDFDMGRMLIDNLIFACAMYRRADWEQVGGYSEAMHRGFEDHDFWLKVLGLGRRVVRIDEILFRYRDTNGSLSNTMVPQDRVRAFALVFGANPELYVAHAEAFAEQVIGQRDLLMHFKQRYGRIEDRLSRLGRLRRRALARARR